MSLPSYIPILKSADAELRAFSHLDDEVKDQILPLFELTRSRSSKRLPEGDIFKRVDQIKENVDGRPFILDLTTFDNLINSQIEELLDPGNGFDHWCSFVEGLGIDALIPMIHAIDDDPLNDLASEVQRLDANFKHLAFRADMFDPDTPDYYRTIHDNISDIDKLIVVIDASFIRQAHSKTFSQTAIRRIDEILRVSKPGMVFVSGSSFPRSVTDYGEDLNDMFPLEEVLFYRLVRDHYDGIEVFYSDYATVHPIRYDVRGGNWVPRVDLILEDMIIYYRYRRDDGGYVRAAAAAVADPAYISIGSWGDSEIAAAASGNPNGRSPAYWISVRINSHITRKAKIDVL